MREKLIALIGNTYVAIPPQIYRAVADDTAAAVIADHLIANGVTFAKDNDVPTKWIPVTERLPKKAGYYLVAHQRSGCVAERFYYRDCPDLFVEVTGDPVTHWMPLPEPPKEVKR